MYRSGYTADRAGSNKDMTLTDDELERAIEDNRRWREHRRQAGDLAGDSTDSGGLGLTGEEEE